LNPIIGRRTLLLAAASLPFAHGRGMGSPAEVLKRLAALERDLGGRLGLAAHHMGSGRRVAYHAQQRFAFCSTFKVIAVSALLKRSEREPGLMQRHIDYAKSDLVDYSPVTSKHVGQGMVLADICAAALQYSDDTAANLIIRELGGPAAVTRFARSIGDKEFRLDRLETALNSAVPGDLRDTTTPAAMLRDLQFLLLGKGLGSEQQARLIGWMRGNTTGDKRIRAGVPRGWQVADKTGSGDYGAANDIGVLWPPGGKPILLCIYTVREGKHAAMRDDIIAAATRIIVEAVA
jgi:beta-lactamase class A